MNKLDSKKRAQVVAALVEGNSIRSTCRMTGVAKNTVTKVLVELGTACERFQQKTLVDLRCRRIQCDEVWSCCYATEVNVPDHMRGEPGVGDVWTWLAIDADSKLAVSWMLGDRSSGAAWEFMQEWPPGWPTVYSSPRTAWDTI